jgi:hypothetical protein
LQFDLLSDTPGSELPFYSFIRAGAGMGGEEIVGVELVIHPEGARGQALPADVSWARVYRYADPSCTAWVDGITMPIGELLQQKRQAILAIADGRLIGDAIRRAPAGRGGSRGGRPGGPGGRGGRDAGDAGDAGDDSHARVARGPAPSASVLRHQAAQAARRAVPPHHNVPPCRPARGGAAAPGRGGMLLTGAGQGRGRPLAAAAAHEASLLADILPRARAAQAPDDIDVAIAAMEEDLAAADGAPPPEPPAAPPSATHSAGGSASSSAGHEA